MNDRKGIGVAIVVAVGVLLTSFFWLRSTARIGINEIIMVVIVLTLVAIAMYIVWDRIKNIQKGLPAKDERSTNISYKAGYYAFIAAIWSAVFSPIFLDEKLDGGDVAAIVVLVSGFVFVLSYIYMYWKGE